jgi:hypothetical protein
MDFGFIRSSTEDYKRPNTKTDRVVLMSVNAPRVLKFIQRVGSP